jgi:predicted RNase H-like nuclease (RuvC/YqgF family)
MKRSAESRKNTNYDMLGVFIQLCFNMGLKLEELHESHDELQECVNELQEKVECLDKELQCFRDSLAH